MRVLGVDPGLTRCGVGVVEGAAGRPLRLVHVEWSVPRPTPTCRAAAGPRRRAGRAVAAYAPDVVAVERVFSQHNVRTVMGTAQAAALAVLAAARAGVPVALHTPSEVKAAVTGSGRADKAQVTTMVTRLLQLPARPRPADAADALALAICQLWRGGPAQAAADRRASAREGADDRERARHGRRGRRRRRGGRGRRSRPGRLLHPGHAGPAARRPSRPGCPPAWSSGRTR